MYKTAIEASFIKINQPSLIAGHIPNTPPRLEASFKLEEQLNALAGERIGIQFQEYFFEGLVIQENKEFDGLTVPIQRWVDLAIDRIRDHNRNSLLHYEGLTVCIDGDVNQLSKFFT